MKSGIINMVNSRKFTWIIVFITILLSIIAVVLLPDIIPMHMNEFGSFDSYACKIQIFIYPALDIAVMFFTGRKRIKYFLMNSKRVLNDIEYNWRISIVCGLILLIESYHLYRILS